jgi:hypothetical protein
MSPGSQSELLRCTCAKAFPLGLGVLACEGVIAWRHAVAGLAGAAVLARQNQASGRPAVIPVRGCAPGPGAAQFISAVTVAAVTGSPAVSHP